MSLSKRSKEIKEMKLAELEEKIKAKNSRLDSLKVSHEKQIAEVQNEIDELTVLKDALTSLK